MQFEVTSQLSALQARLEQAYEALDGDKSPILEVIAGIVERSAQQRFIDKKSPDGIKWADLADSTLEAKNGRGSILVDRGDLMGSITAFASDDTVEVGADRDYAKYHQTGTNNADGSLRMVARPFLGLSEEDENDIRDVLNDFLEDLL